MFFDYLQASNHNVIVCKKIYCYELSIDSYYSFKLCLNQGKRHIQIKVVKTQIDFKSKKKRRMNIKDN